MGKQEYPRVVAFLTLKKKSNLFAISINLNRIFKMFSFHLKSLKHWKSNEKYETIHLSIFILLALYADTTYSLINII